MTIKAFKAFKKKYVHCTVPGFAVFAIALVVLVRSLAARNAHEVVLSLAVLLLWAALLLAGKWAVRRLAVLEPLWNIPAPLRAAIAPDAADWLVTPPPGINVPVFFRLHFLVRGRFFPQGARQSCAVFAETSAPKRSRRTANATTDDDASTRLSIAFPLGGLFRGETSCRLRDIFGFFSFPCGGEQEQTLSVSSAASRAIPLRIDALSGAEDRRNKNANDEERYYMREYAPGDRFRDINWKSSGRINTLITRISPDNQEKITQIEVHFRNYGGCSPGIAELWLLDRAKARLAWFLRKAREEKDSYVFCIRSAGQSWELHDDEEIAAFLQELAAIPFCPPDSGEAAPTETSGGGEIYVFSTACDTALPAFLAAHQHRPVSLFLAENVDRGRARDTAARAANKVNPDVETLCLRSFFSGGFFPRPRWLVRRRERWQVNVSASRMMIDYAEITL